MDGCINIKNAKWKKDFSAIDASSNAQTSVLHSKSYLHHLFRCEELLAMQIASIHNLAFFLQLVRLARTQIQQGTFAAWKNSLVPNLERRL
jgi:queuine tRNA-ribosyltransferase